MTKLPVDLSSVTTLGLDLAKLILFVEAVRTLIVTSPMAQNVLAVRDAARRSAGGDGIMTPV